MVHHVKIDICLHKGDCMSQADVSKLKLKLTPLNPFQCCNGGLLKIIRSVAHAVLCSGQ